MKQMMLVCVVLFAFSALVSFASGASKAEPKFSRSLATVYHDYSKACRGNYGELIVAHRSLPCGTRIKFCYTRARGVRNIAQSRWSSTTTASRQVLGEGAGRWSGRLLDVAGRKVPSRLRSDSSPRRQKQASDREGTSSGVRASRRPDSRRSSAGSFVRDSRLREPRTSRTSVIDGKRRADPQADVSQGPPNGGYRQASSLPGLRGSTSARRVPLTRCAWARVADRGPFTAATWDLDSALASRIGFPYSVAYVKWRRAR